ncbi:MAG: DUF1275 domain-containing protein [Pedobacter sp.]|nr:MAG: DUF1275 domain-containing protein [Pedobacter sp.]
MLRHFGTRRTFKHNFRLAVLLCLTAGFINAAGFLGFLNLTTNVTGHAALFAEQIVQQEWRSAGKVAVWMLLFLSGAWCSSAIINTIGYHARFSFAIPIALEMIIFMFCAIYGGNDRIMLPKGFFVGCLLFAMGLQNAMVSVISGSVVRTTHLTGTFTDLGIELAQLANKNHAGRKDLISKIKLRLSSIISFLIGALFGAYIFGLIGFRAFIIPCFVVCLTLFFDLFRLHVKRYYTHMIHLRKPT